MTRRKQRGWWTSARDLKALEELLDFDVSEADLSRFLSLCGEGRRSRELTRDEDLFLRFVGPKLIEEVRASRKKGG